MRNFLRQAGFKIKCSAVYKVAPGKSSPNRSEEEVLRETGGGALSTLSHSARNGGSRATLLVSFSHVRHFPKKIRNGLWLGYFAVFTGTTHALTTCRCAGVKAQLLNPMRAASLCPLCTGHNQCAYPIELQDVTTFRTQGGNMVLNCAS